MSFGISNSRKGAVQPALRTDPLHNGQRLAGIAFKRSTRRAALGGMEDPMHRYYISDLMGGGAYGRPRMLGAKQKKSRSLAESVQYAETS